MKVVTFLNHRPTGKIHVLARESGTPRKGVPTLCGLSVTPNFHEMAPFGVGANRLTVDGGVPKNPFYGDRGCDTCTDQLAI